MLLNVKVKEAQATEVVVALMFLWIPNRNGSVPQVPYKT